MNALREVLARDGRTDKDLVNAILAAATDAPHERPDVHVILTALDSVSDVKEMAKLMTGRIGYLWHRWDKELCYCKYIEKKATTDLTTPSSLPVPTTVDSSLYDALLPKANFGKRESQLYKDHLSARSGKQFTHEDAHYLFRALDAALDESTNLLENEPLRSLWHTWHEHLRPVPSIRNKLQSLTTTTIAAAKDLGDTSDTALQPYIDDLFTCLDCNALGAAPDLVKLLSRLCDRTLLLKYLNVPGIGFRLTKYSKCPNEVEQLYTKLRNPETPPVEKPPPVETSGLERCGTTNSDWDRQQSGVCSDWEDDADPVTEKDIKEVMDKRNRVVSIELGTYMANQCQRACVLSCHGHPGKRNNEQYARFGVKHEAVYNSSLKQDYVCYENVVLDIDTFKDVIERCTVEGKVYFLQVSVDARGVKGLDSLEWAALDVVVLERVQGCIKVSIQEVKSSRSIKTGAQGQAATYKMMLEAMIEQTGCGFSPEVSVSFCTIDEVKEDWDMSLATAGLKLALEDIKSEKFWEKPKALLDYRCVYENCQYLERCRKGLEGSVESITGSLRDIEDIGIEEWCSVDIDTRHKVVGGSPVKWNPNEAPRAFEYGQGVLMSLPCSEDDVVDVFVETYNTAMHGERVALWCQGVLHKKLSYTEAASEMGKLLGDEFSGKKVQAYTLEKGTANQLSQKLRVANPLPESRDKKVGAPMFVALSVVARDVCMVPVLYSDYEVIQHFKKQCSMEKWENEATERARLGEVILAHLRTTCSDMSIHAGAYTPKRRLITASDDVEVVKVLDDLQSTRNHAEAAEWLTFLHKRLAEEKLEIEVSKKRTAAWKVIKCITIEHSRTQSSDSEDEPTAKVLQEVRLLPINWDKLRQTTGWEYELLSFDEALQNLSGVRSDVTKMPVVQRKKYFLSSDLYLDFEKAPKFKKDEYYVLRRRANTMAFAKRVREVAVSKKAELFAFANPHRFNEGALIIEGSVGDGNGLGGSLTSAQKDLVKCVSTRRLSVCSGPPGSGKTVAARAAITHVLRHTKGVVCVVSKNVAAVKQVLRDIRCHYGHVNTYGEWVGHETPRVYGMGLESFCSETTVFNFPKQKVGRKWVSTGSMTIPREFDFLVVDEASQVEGYVAAALLHRLKKEGRLLVLGDPMQLGVNYSLTWSMQDGLPLVSGSLLMSVLRKADGTAVREADDVAGGLASYIVKQDQYLRSDARINELTACLYGGSVQPTVKELQRVPDTTLPVKWQELGNGDLGGLLVVQVRNPTACGTFTVARELAACLRDAYRVAGEKPEVHFIRKMVSKRNKEENVVTIEGCQGLTTNVCITALDQEYDSKGDRHFCKVSMMNVAFTRASHLAVLVLPIGYTPHPSVAQYEECRKGFAHIQRFVSMCKESSRLITL